MKDFLFLNYSYVPNSTFIFKSFENLGYSCDFVDENSIYNFIPSHEYKIIIVYLHDDDMISHINKIINSYCKNSFLIQHDDTDSEHVQKWCERKPDLIMQRELTKDTINVYGSPIFPFHFPIHSKYNKIFQEKIYDVCFLANRTNPRREPFINYVEYLMNNDLKFLNWKVNITWREQTNNYDEFINNSKIGLHYYGNSYDSWRIWELASTKTAIIMPKLKLKSCDENNMHFDKYCAIKDDFSDLKEKILHLLANDRYKNLAEEAYIDYNLNHTPEKVFQNYFDIIKKQSKLI